MVYTSDMQLQSMGVKRMEDLPKRVGMRFRGVLRDGSSVACEVADGGQVRGDFDVISKTLCADDLIGWTEQGVVPHG